MGKAEEKETVREVPPIEEVKMVGNRPITKNRRKPRKKGKARQVLYALRTKSSTVYSMVAGHVSVA
jgi:hypothetical protein